MIRGVWHLIRNCPGHSDQRLVEFACLCVIHVINSYYRSYPENLEILVDAELITAVHVLPRWCSPFVAANTFTQLLRALATSARASPNITIVLLEARTVAPYTKFSQASSHPPAPKAKNKAMRGVDKVSAADLPT